MVHRGAESAEQKGGVMSKPVPFEVIVGNVGTVYSGSNYMVAQTTYTHYVKQSARGGGRAAGESVVLMHNGEPRREYAPPEPPEAETGTPVAGDGDPHESYFRALDRK
jgi:hypothetical protein